MFLLELKFGILKKKGCDDMYCDWKDSSELMKNYHDQEWGYPSHEDRELFEYLVLESMQAGLSWEIILKKREIMRSCFSNFEYELVSQYQDSEIDQIMKVEGMIHSPRKIKAMISNAQCFKQVVKEFGSFDAYLWSYTNGKTWVYPRLDKMPSSNDLSKIISDDLKKRGFKYAGPVIIYSYLQACGIINDHDKSCPCYQEINKNYPVEFKF